MKKLAPALVGALGILFLAGLVHLFQLRFTRGDLYPRYSSLRSDPLGTKALFQSLEPLLETGRHLGPLAQLGPGRGRTLFYLGARADELRFPGRDRVELERFLAGGGRMVLSFHPSYQHPQADADPISPKPADTKNQAGRKRPPSPLLGMKTEAVKAGELWGFDIKLVRLEKSEADWYQAAPAYRRGTPETGELPEEISCHTALCFTALDRAWKPVYVREPNLPVVVERAVGQGSLVLLADSYLLSNEALLRERHPALLSWLVGSAKGVVFEETHLGVAEDPGLASLIHKYRLHGMVAGLLLLALLFVWRNAFSFMPPQGETLPQESASTVQGRESAVGFVNLLRRSIPAGQIFDLCLAEWEKSCRRETSPQRQKQVQALLDRERQLSPPERNSVRTYQQISRILTRHPEP